MSSTTALPTSPPQSSPIPSIKDLASSNAALRRQNLSLILTHLHDRPSTPALTLQQCLVLWRGFSVALYMHDSKNALSVQKLITTLANTVELMHDRDLEVQQSSVNGEGDEGTRDEQWQWTKTWSEAFWETISKEWSGIDQWRMNKYLLLVRLLLRTVFGTIAEGGAAGGEKEVSAKISKPKMEFTGNMQKAGRKRKHEDNEDGENSTTGPITRQKKVDDDLVSTQVSVLEQWPLSATNRKVSDGLRLHVLDVWNDEIKKAGLEDEVVAKLMQPVKNIAKGGDGISPSVKRKAREVLAGA